MNDIFVDPSARVETADIGTGTRIWAFTHVMKGARIGVHCNVGEHCFVEAGASVGDGVTIKNGNELWDGIILDDGVFVGPKVCFTNDLRPRSPRLPQAKARYATRGWLVSTRIEEGASLGAGSVILAGTTIGKYAIVGAGAVVTRSVPPHALVIGVPARVVGWVCQCGAPLKFGGASGTCHDCGLTYQKQGAVVFTTRKIPQKRAVAAGLSTEQTATKRR